MVVNVDGVKSFLAKQREGWCPKHNNGQKDNDDDDDDGKQYIFSVCIEKVNSGYIYNIFK